MPNGSGDTPNSCRRGYLRGEVVVFLAACALQVQDDGYHVHMALFQLPKDLATGSKRLLRDLKHGSKLPPGPRVASAESQWPSRRRGATDACLTRDCSSWPIPIGLRGSGSPMPLALANPRPRGPEGVGRPSGGGLVSESSATPLSAVEVHRERARLIRLEVALQHPEMSRRALLQFEGVWQPCQRHLHLRPKSKLRNGLSIFASLSS